MDYQLEVILLPVSDVDRSLAFYTEQVGFPLDVDYRPSDDFRVVQLTPRGSACSVQLTAAPGDARRDPYRSTYLVVPDIEAARAELLERGVPVGEIRHKSPSEAWQGAGRLVPIRRGVTTQASSTSPTRTATSGCCRNGCFRPTYALHRDGPTGGDRHQGRR
jgi:predicted enzyme related to lactoylglutathione lyase